jgi:hypothetical protein
MLPEKVMLEVVLQVIMHRWHWWHWRQRQFQMWQVTPHTIKLGQSDSIKFWQRYAERQSKLGQWDIRDGWTWSLIVASFLLSNVHHSMLRVEANCYLDLRLLLRILMMASNHIKDAWEERNGKLSFFIVSWRCVVGTSLVKEGCSNFLKTITFLSEHFHFFSKSGKFGLTPATWFPSTLSVFK